VKNDKSKVDTKTNTKPDTKDDTDDEPALASALFPEDDEW
jgi:hypothetical protein